MAHAKLFVRVNISKSSGYISIDEMVHESEIESSYEDHVKSMKKFGQPKWETFEGYKLCYINLNVKYDGRKKRISEEDVLKSFENEGLAKYSGSSMFGSYYLPTEELTLLMSDNLNERKVLAGLIIEEVSTTIEEEETKEESVEEMTTQTIEDRLSNAKTNEDIAAIAIDLIIKENKANDKSDVIRERDTVIKWINERLYTGNYLSMTKEGLENAKYNVNTIQGVSEEVTNQLNQTISNLINSHPNYNQSDIQELDNLAQYADLDTLSLIGKFLHTVYYLNGKDSLTFLHAIYSQLDTEEAASHEDSYNATQSYSYTVTDGYLPEPLSGTIEADTPIHADQLIREIYASELDTTESELTIEIY